MPTEIKFKLQTPQVPNYIRIEMPTSGTKQDGFKELPSLSVGELSDDQLESLAIDWKKALFEKAKQQRLTQKA